MVSIDGQLLQIRLHLVRVRSEIDQARDAIDQLLEIRALVDEPILRELRSERPKDKNLPAMQR